MRIKNAEFVTSAVKQNQYPETVHPEVAFVGRSNVGKSTIINALTNRRKLAKVSNTPGRTRLVNFFLINGQAMLVDLPGYGYAKISKSDKAAWGKIIEDYIVNSPNLKRFVLLVDSRHKPTQDDIAMMDYLRYYEKDVVVIGTKLDKLKRNDIKKSEKLIRETLQMEKEEPLFLYSSTSKENLQQVIDLVFKDLLPEEA
ncbi:ribosome biogenesis GTP-binding protein YihA/YsxC [Proteiniclasticum ruminis]|uniref:ribosome biogenesis GTP-binding protein YihA/YsxC n=1 Tax=Proteiniclasticum ruminis TaxID=398199 RepID=UPI0004E1A7C5|nr:ribosome biogenesis GTP-binding protein YihA/YsxC [Proteiniclasticum ruminis]MBP9920446.1 YihA family ribosome biogenesis GTP-binding protein [Proteiniclasticum sp.]